MVSLIYRGSNPTRNGDRTDDRFESCPDYKHMGTLMEGGNKTYNMVRSGVTVWLMTAPSAGPSSSLGVSTKRSGGVKVATLDLKSGG